MCKIIVNLRVQKCRISFGLYSLCLRAAHSSTVKFNVPLRFYTHRTCILPAFVSSARKRKDMDKTRGQISGTGSDWVGRRVSLSKSCHCYLQRKETGRSELNVFICSVLSDEMRAFIKITKLFFSLINMLKKISNMVSFK